MDKTPQYLTEDEAAKVLRRSPKTLTRWRRLRTSPPVAVVNGRVLYPADELHQWVKNQLVNGSAQ